MKNRWSENSFYKFLSLLAYYNDRVSAGLVLVLVLERRHAKKAAVGALRLSWERSLADDDDDGRVLSTHRRRKFQALILLRLLLLLNDFNCGEPGSQTND